MDDEAHHGTPELAPGLRRLNGTDLIVWGYPDRITPVSLLALQRLPSQSLYGQAPVGPPSGAFLFHQPHRDLCTRIRLIKTMIDVLLFHLSIVLVDESLHAIQYHGLIQIGSACRVVDRDIY